VNYVRPENDSLTIKPVLLTFFIGLPVAFICRNPLRWKEVRELNEINYRKWMVVIAAGTLLVSIIRLLIGV
jgi:hypothetical protein